MKPKFTGSYVFHFMGDAPPTDEKAWEELSGGFNHDREHERCATAYSDDDGLVSGAALDLLVEHAPADLKEGDYVFMMVAGTMNYVVYHDYFNGDESDLVIEPEWHSIRVMDPEERRAHDEYNGIAPNVPLALYTEVAAYDAWAWPKNVAVFAMRPMFQLAPTARALADMGVGSGIVKIDGAVVESGIKLDDPLVQPVVGAILSTLRINDVPLAEVLSGPVNRASSEPPQQLLFDSLPVVQVPPKVQPLQRCAADRDGDCVHALCPQLRDGEPNKSGRHCPLDIRDDDD